MSPANPITTFPALPSPMPFMPQFGDFKQFDKSLKENMEKAMVEMVKNPEHDFHKNIKQLVLQICDEDFTKKMKRKFSDKHHEEEPSEEENEHFKMKALFCHINSAHKKIREGKPVFEIEQETKKSHEFTPEEERVYCALLKSDGPVAMAHMLDMKLEDFIKRMNSIGEKLSHEEEEED